MHSPCTCALPTAQRRPSARPCRCSAPHPPPPPFFGGCQEQVSYGQLTRPVERVWLRKTINIVITNTWEGRTKSTYLNFSPGQPPRYATGLLLTMAHAPVGMPVSREILSPGNSVAATVFSRKFGRTLK